MIRRTDLAIENKEMFEEGNGEGSQIPGVNVKAERYGDDVTVTRITIEDERGSAIMNKPQGRYITVEIKGGVNGSEEIKEMAARAVAAELTALIPFHHYLKVLVVGLGNEKVTPDSLGPHTVSKIRVTRHLFLHYEVEGDDDQANVSALNPGVMASTGMESGDLIYGAAEITDPEVILVIDSLAARSIERINTTIQITDTGISPGAGMGNHRKVLTSESMGRKVVAVGVPTVIDAGSMVLDSLADYLSDADRAEDYIQQAKLDMIVTPTDIDEVIHDFSEIIASAINIALHPGIYS
ncbi:GPR endopeptidase [Bacilliculturomica massiliensis]|uniref:GPR endopeptidase n=1 Tax=Bacilliculturomica massiliensis TaxID=1917867 RepID=UPI001030463E|nr:GPR endopeptidase [Bacilliculturomica massiliensis]